MTKATNDIAPAGYTLNATKRNQVPSRFRKVKSSAKLAGVQHTIETLMGLPTGCVRFVMPAGRKVRSDATIETLKAHWSE